MISVRLGLLLLVSGSIIAACTAAPSQTPPGSSSTTVSPMALPTLPQATVTFTPASSRGGLFANTSPDGKWMANGSGEFLPGGQYQAMLRVTNNETGREWMAEKYTEDGGTTMLITPQPLHWSRDGQFLYFTHQSFSDGCVADIVNGPFRGTDLWRLNLQSGEVIQLAPRVGYWLSLSPDETMLAFLSDDNRLAIRNLNSGQERSVTFIVDADYPGERIRKAGLLWAPDGGALVFTAVMGVCQEDMRTFVVLVHGETLSQTILIREERRGFTTMEWPEPNRILLRDEDDGFWWLDVVTGKVESF